MTHQSTFRILYFVHDLTHPDIGRRVDMLRLGGATVVLLGFQRLQNHAFEPGTEVINLGMTYDGKLHHRLFAVMRSLWTLRKHKAALQGNAIVCRNLEMLVVGAVAKWLYLANKPLIYECLDIHRIMCSSGRLSKVFASIESAILRSCSVLIVSSPGFIRYHFDVKNKKPLPRTLLIENKLFPVPMLATDSHAISRQRPWRIGWFGAIRCRRSLEILAEACRRSPGTIEVIIAGRPATQVFPDLAAEVAGMPGISFVGGYEDEQALARLHAMVDFAWCIDFFETGANSDWLLPNRLYRSVYYRVVPIALNHVETGRWLQSHGTGFLLDCGDAEEVLASFERLTADRFAGLLDSLSVVPEDEVIATPDECRSIVRTLESEPSLQASLAPA